MDISLMVIDIITIWRNSIMRGAYPHPPLENKR